MGSSCRLGLAEWFDQGLASGQFEVPNGRHIVLNEFPRFMKVSRLRASAGVDQDDLLDFLMSINPTVEPIADGSPDGMRRKLANEDGQLPALRKAFIKAAPSHQYEHWFVYTPPLHIMRESWRAVKAKFA